MSLEEEYCQFLENNKERIMRLCNIYSTNTSQAKDLFQEVALNIWKAMPRFRREAKADTWVYRIALNVCLREQARNKRRPSTSLTGLHWEIPEDTNNENNHRLEQLQYCIRKLNQTDRSLALLYLEDLPYKDIASILGISENLVAVKMKRVRQKLHKCIIQL